MDAFVALYLFMLAGVTGYVLIANVPSILHTPLLSGSNFIHGVVLAGAMVALGHADGVLQTTIGFVGVMAATANVVGGYVVTDRMLAMFESSAKRHQRQVEEEKNQLIERDKPDQEKSGVDSEHQSDNNNGSQIE